MKTKIKSIITILVIILISSSIGYAQKLENQDNNEFYTKKFLLVAKEAMQIQLEVQSLESDINYLIKTNGDTLTINSLEFKLENTKHNLYLIDISLNILYVAIDCSTITEKQKYLDEITNRRSSIYKIIGDYKIPIIR